MNFQQGIIEAERPLDPTLQNGKVGYYDLAELIQSENSEVMVIIQDDEILASGFVTFKMA